MFIEKISEANKKAYIQKLVDRYNLNKDAKDADFLRMFQGNPWSSDILKQRGYDRKLQELNARNVYFGIYQNFDSHGWNRTSHEYAVIAAFGDASVKTYKVSVGMQDYLATNYENTFEFLRKYEQQIFAENPLAIDNTYIKEFMLPNLKEIDATQGTHLVADYQAAVDERFKKKERLLIKSLKKQRADVDAEADLVMKQ